MSSTNSVSDVNRTRGRSPVFDEIEAADGMGMAGVLVFWSEVERIVRVDRNGGFVPIGVRSDSGGNVCANSLTRSIALSSRLSLEMHRFRSEAGAG